MACSVKLTLAFILFISSRGVAVCPVPNNGYMDLSNKGWTADDLRSLLKCPHLGDVKTLNLSGNQLTSLSLDMFDDDVTFYQLRHLDVSYNNIKTIDHDTFSLFRHLTSLNISNNQLTALEDGLLDGLSNLQQLFASYNNISRIGKHLFQRYQFPNLNIVDMKNNSLTSFEPWPYIIANQMNSYIDFDLSYNLINNFTNNINWSYDLIEPYMRIKVNLTHNKLSHYRDEFLLQYHRAGDVAMDMPTYMIDIRNNPWFCDCHMYYLVSEFQKSFYKYSDSSYMFKVECAGPFQLKGKDIFHDANPRALACNLTDNCPSGCLCQRRPHEKLLYVLCSNGNLKALPTVLPDLQEGESYELHLENNMISNLAHVDYVANITALFLSGNGLKTIDPKALKGMEKITHLNVSQNHLHSVPKQIQRLKYENADISHNPIDCTCEMIWMSDWISVSDFDTPGRNIECTREEKENIQILDVANELDCDYNMEIGLAICLGLVFVVVVIAIVWAKRCPYETKVLLFRFFRFHPADRYAVDETATEYDLYVSFDDESIHIRQWVLKKLIRKLEQEKPMYRLFVPCRDLMTGGEKGPDIITAMKNSSRVLIILSDEYDRNEWCLFEAQQAEILDFNEGRVLFMKYHPYVDQMIEEEPWKSRLKGRKMLIIGDKRSERRWFWSKLRYELPVKRKSTFSSINYAINDAYR